MIDSEEDPTLRAVLVGILREPNRLRNSNQAHAAEFGKEVPVEPLVFLKPSTAVDWPARPDPVAADQRPSSRRRCD
jgi:hypothetical protein